MAAAVDFGTVSEELASTTEDADECASNPCQNGATCTDHVNSFSCSCLPGFTGEKCEKNIDDCAGSPCKNGATCHDGINQYTCACVGEFKGSNCEIPKEPPCRTIHNPRFHGGNKACNWPNVGHTARQVCRDNGYNSVKNWHESGQRVDCYGWRGHWKHDSNPGWITSITCCK